MEDPLEFTILAIRHAVQRPDVWRCVSLIDSRLGSGEKNRVGLLAARLGISFATVARIWRKWNI
jgi:hypothetical protein